MSKKCYQISSKKNMLNFSKIDKEKNNSLISNEKKCQKCGHSLLEHILSNCNKCRCQGYFCETF